MYTEKILQSVQQFHDGSIDEIKMILRIEAEIEKRLKSSVVDYFDDDLYIIDYFDGTNRWVISLYLETHPFNETCWKVEEYRIIKNPILTHEYHI